MAGYAVLRERVLAQGTEQKVLVNQRHLIDKILARYSAEYTVYRELLQNSDDAGVWWNHVLSTAQSLFKRVGKPSERF